MSLTPSFCNSIKVLAASDATTFSTEDIALWEFVTIALIKLSTTSNTTELIFSSLPSNIGSPAIIDKLAVAGSTGDATPSLPASVVDALTAVESARDANVSLPVSVADSLNVADSSRDITVSFQRHLLVH